MASKRRIRKNACTGKRRFDDKQAALACMCSMLRHKPTRLLMTAYHCKWCKGWHYGHSS